MVAIIWRKLWVWASSMPVEDEELADSIRAVIVATS
jgi:hypothetical protein